MRVFFSIRYDTIRYEGLKEDLLFEEFLANFQNFRRIFGEFSEFSANFQNFRRIFGEFSEFSANFWNFRRKKTKKSLVLRISRYTIWEVRYDILFDIRKSPISRHSINSRYDKLPLDCESNKKGEHHKKGLTIDMPLLDFFTFVIIRETGRAEDRKIHTLL